MIRIGRGIEDCFYQIVCPRVSRGKPNGYGHARPAVRSAIGSIARDVCRALQR